MSPLAALPPRAPLRALVLRPALGIVVAQWVGFAGLMAASGAWLWAGWAWAAGGAIYGVLCYSLIEYAAHRWVMHRPGASAWWRRITGNMAAEHDGHHADPHASHAALNSHQSPMLGAALLLLGGALLLPGPAAFGLFAMAAGALAHLGQELAHYACHALPVRGRWLAGIKRRHMLHHHRDPGSEFGILFGWWDVAFGTTYRARAARRAARRDCAARGRLAVE